MYIYFVYIHRGPALRLATWFRIYLLLRNRINTESIYLREIGEEKMGGGPGTGENGANNRGHFLYSLSSLFFLLFIFFYLEEFKRNLFFFFSFHFFRSFHLFFWGEEEGVGEGRRGEDKGKRKTPRRWWGPGGREKLVYVSWSGSVLGVGVWSTEGIELLEPAGNYGRDTAGSVVKFIEDLGRG